MVSCLVWYEVKADFPCNAIARFRFDPEGSTGEKISGFGYILLGIGFLFLGIHYMKEGFEAFQSVIDISSFSMKGMQGILAFTLFGVLGTIIMQSTNAVLVLTFSALAMGQLTYDNALALAIGSNIGTTVTAVLGAMGANAAGKRLAVAHITFNVTTAILAILLLPPVKGACGFYCRIFADQGRRLQPEACAIPQPV